MEPLSFNNIGYKREMCKTCCFFFFLIGIWIYNSNKVKKVKYLLLNWVDNFQELGFDYGQVLCYAEQHCVELL